MRLFKRSCLSSLTQSFANFATQTIKKPTPRVIPPHLMEVSKNKTIQRLERVVSNRGGGSRSEVRKLIAGGKVAIDGQVVKNTKLKVHRKATNITVNDLVLPQEKDVIEGPTLIVYNKPTGILSSVGDPQGRLDLKSVYAQFPDELFRYHPVGRLDLDTSGLLLFSNNGDLTKRLLDPTSNIEREYSAVVLGEVDHAALAKRLGSGVRTSDGIFVTQLISSSTLKDHEKLALFPDGIKVHHTVLKHEEQIPVRRVIVDVAATLNQTLMRPTHVERPGYELGSGGNHPRSENQTSDPSLETTYMIEGADGSYAVDDTIDIAAVSEEQNAENSGSSSSDVSGNDNSEHNKVVSMRRYHAADMPITITGQLDSDEHNAFIGKVKHYNKECEVVLEAREVEEEVSTDVQPYKGEIEIVITGEQLTTQKLSVVNLTATEGKYRMIRRILHNAGHSVVKLQRVRYGGVTINGLIETPMISAPAENNSTTAGLLENGEQKEQKPGKIVLFGEENSISMAKKRVVQHNSTLFEPLLVEQEPLEEGQIRPLTRPEKKWLRKLLEKSKKKTLV